MPPGFDALIMKNNNDDAASAHSSSSISSPPVSPQNTTFSDTIRVARPAVFTSPRLANLGALSNNLALSNPDTQPALAANNNIPLDTNANVISNTTSTANSSSANGANPEKPKRQRKKKEPETDGKLVEQTTKFAPDWFPPKPKEKKPRKPREVKEKPVATNATGPRKKQKLEPATTTTTTTKPDPDAPPPAAAPRQPTITEMVKQFSSQPSPTTNASNSNTPKIVVADTINRALGLPMSKPPTPRPISSGQNYDPIRGYDPVRAASMETTQSRPVNPTNPTPPAHLNRASASPSISSLIDPPSMSKASLPTTSNPSQPIAQNPSQFITQQQPFVRSQPQSPAQSKPTPTLVAPLPVQASPPSVTPQMAPVALDGAMDIDLTCDVPKPPPSVKVMSKASSPAPTPKAARPTPPPAPKGTGSGLLSSSSLFGGPSPSETMERKGVNIDLHIPLNPSGGNTINIAQEIAKKYGRDAINPRAAAHRARLLEVAAAANKIEGGDIDDMSLDDLSDMEDSNVEMGGMNDEDKSGLENGGGTTTAGESKPRKRRAKKAEEYNKDDDFIDDTELAWQQHAAVAKDGFFVYSGPLVPPGTDAQIETSTSGAPTRGGRGRGRGRGSRGGATGTASGTTTHASVAAATAASKDPNAPPPPPTASRGRGRGRGAPGVPRKPRTTKAEKEKAAAASGSMGGTLVPVPVLAATASPASSTPVLGGGTSASKVALGPSGSPAANNNHALGAAGSAVGSNGPPQYAQIMGTTAV